MYRYSIQINKLVDEQKTLFFYFLATTRNMKDIKAVFDIGNDFIKATVFANDNEKEIVLAKQMEPNQ